MCFSFKKNTNFRKQITLSGVRAFSEGLKSTFLSKKKKNRTRAMCKPLKSFFKIFIIFYFFRRIEYQTNADVIVKHEVFIDQSEFVSIAAEFAVIVITQYAFNKLRIIIIIVHAFSPNVSYLLIYYIVMRHCKTV